MLLPPGPVTPLKAFPQKPDQGGGRQGDSDHQIPDVD